jgi:CHAD domain-containing protein
MAKAREIPGLRAETPYAAAAAATVRVRAQELFDHADAVLDTSDIERVHDMRVASRRLRAALEIYAPCFARKAFEAVLRDVKALADALGARRDPDVQLAHLDGLSGALGDESRPGLDVFAAMLRDEQAAGNAVLARALEAATAQDLRGRLEALARGAERRAAP